MFEARVSGAVCDENHGWPATGPRCGVPADKRLIASDVYAIEGKLGTTVEGQLELVNYLNLFGDEFHRGILIGHDEFWLIEAHHRSVVRRVIGKWTDAGCVALIREFEFFPVSPWGLAVNQASIALNCELIDPKEDKTTAFLGAGACGRVFRIGNDHALKVTLTTNIAALEQEYYAIKRIHDRKRTANVVHVMKFTSDASSYAACTLQPVGVAVASGTKFDVATVFHALHRLHKNDICHGDARLENLIQGQKQWLWIDFVFTPATTTTRTFQRDCKDLARSVLHHHGFSDVFDEDEIETSGTYFDLINAIGQYSEPQLCIQPIISALNKLISSSSSVSSSSSAAYANS